MTTTRQMTIFRHRFEQPFLSISAIKHFVIRLVENSVIPRSCIRARSFFPGSSTKLMFVRSTTSAASPVEHSCQHLSSSFTHGPASFPSRKSIAADESFLAVILIICNGERNTCNYLAVLDRAHLLVRLSSSILVKSRIAAA